MEEENLNFSRLPARQRGSYSSKFRTTDILTNYYKVDIANIKTIYIFALKFEPSIPADSTKKRLSLLTEAIPELKKHIENPVFSSTNIFSTCPSKTEEKFQVKVDNYTLTIKQVKHIGISQDIRPVLNFLNVALRNVMRRHNYSELGKSRKFFNTVKYDEPDSSIRLFSGYQANFMETEKLLYLRVDPAKKIVRKQRVIDVINNVYSEHKDKDRDEKRLKVKEALVGKTVMTNYGKARYLRIDDVLFETIDNIKISGTETNLRQFYAEKYHIQISNPRQPLLVIKNKNKPEPDLMIPELCLMTGLPDNFDQFRRKKISESTIRPPGQKKEEIEKFIKIIEKEEDFSVMKNLGIQLNYQMETIKAKEIPNPIIKLGQGKIIEKGREAGFNLFAHPIYGSKYQIKLGIIHTQKANVRDPLQTIKNTSKNLGVNVNVTQYNIGDIDPRKSLDAFLKYMQKASDESCNLLFIVIPNCLKTSYKKIKEFALLKLQKVTQIACESTLGKKNVQSIATKILLQIIAKKGNILWVPTVTEQVSNTMIVGFDNASVAGSSIVSACGSMNQTFTSVFSLAERYNSSQLEDKLNKMANLLYKITDNYCKRNKHLPKQIIIFHNACSNDQVNLYREFFLHKAKQHLKEKFQGKFSLPFITLIMVNTKTNERLFTPGKNPSDTRNAKAGTVISTDIVSKNYDFFMVSQFSTKGSTVPNHYRIVDSDSKMEEGILQEIIFSQCFGYVNWTGSIKVPAILQYAKKSARFWSQVLEGKSISSELSSKLFYV